MVPFVADRSLWQTPHAARRMVTSPWRGGSTSISSTATALPTVRATTALARRFIFCYLAWQFRRRKMRCRQTRIAWLGIEMRLADGDAVCAAHETRTSNPADSGSQIKYLTASFGFEPQLDFRSHARIEPLAGAMSSSRVCPRGGHAACDHEDARRKIAAPEAKIRITTRVREGKRDDQNQHPIVARGCSHPGRPRRSGRTRGRRTRYHCCGCPAGSHRHRQPPGREPAKCADHHSGVDRRDAEATECPDFR